MKRTPALFLLLTLGSPLVALAGGAREIVIDDFASFAKGTLEGALLRSSGEITVGPRLERFELPDSFTAYAVARDAKGRAFVGTGPSGKIFVLDGDRLTLFGETGALLVASLAFGPDGTLYAGTLPEGKVFAFGQAGDARELVDLEGAEHVWGLVHDPSRGALIAATGPEGKLFSIDPRGGASVILDTDQEHLLSLAVDRDGTLLVGTDGDALLYRVGPRDEVRVVHEFPGNELRAIAAHDDGIYVAANEMPAPPSPAKREAPAPLVAKLDAAKQGRGRLHRLARDGSVERLLARKDGHFTALSFDPEGNLLVAQAGEGRLFRVEAGDRVGIAADLDDAQLLALDASRAPLLVVTGNGAALHREGRGGAAPAYVSEVFDTGPGSRLGRLSFRGEGAIRVQSRTGPREEPDGSWTDWSTPIASAGPLRSPADRFVQFRVLLPPSGRAALRSLTLGYLPANRRARVSNVRAVTDEKRKGPSPKIALAWDVDEADGDELRFRLTFREESQSVERPMFLEDVILTKPEYTWDTSGIPDGHYVVAVHASDERVNAPSRVETHREESEPVHVDNHAPRFTSMRVDNGRVKGKVVDRMGPIARLELSIDGGPYEDRLPVDGILDGPEEEFDLALSDLPQGEHIVTVRVTDAAHNSARREVIARIGR